MTGSNLKPRNSTGDHLNCDVRKVVETVRSGRVGACGNQDTASIAMTLDDVAAGVLILFGIHLGWHGPWPGAWAGPCEPRSLSVKIPALVMKATPAGPRRETSPFRRDFEVGGKAGARPSSHTALERLFSSCTCLRWRATGESPL